MSHTTLIEQLKAQFNTKSEATEFKIQVNLLSERTRNLTKDEIEALLGHQSASELSMADIASLDELAVRRINQGHTLFTWDSMNIQKKGPHTLFCW